MRKLRSHILIFLLLTVLAVHAEKVELWIHVENPLTKTQPLKIKSNLPPRIRGTNDILNLAGLDLGYDVKTDTYFVHKEISLGPEEKRDFRILIKDVWLVSEDEIAELGQKATALTEQLEKTDFKDLAGEYLLRVTDKLDSVISLQKKNTIASGAKPMQHIRVYDTNLEEMERVRRDVGRLENMVLSSGLDPGGLIGTVKEAPPPDRNIEVPEGKYGKAVIKITVKNASPTETRMINVRNNLPSEVRISDVISSGELEVGVDPKTGITYVHKRGVEVEPLGERTYSVEINDKWNINIPRIRILKETTTNLLETVSSKAKVESVIDMLNSILLELDEIEKEERPKELNEKYVSFFREQASRLDVIEDQINRIRAALRPMQRNTKLGFKAKPPSMKSTWMIIYIILGFLAVVSLLFFLRWYVAPSANIADSVPADEVDDEQDDG